MKICVYVLNKNAKQAYANESFDVRQNAGIAVVVDALQNAGYTVDFAGIANVHTYDIVLFSITSDCDWWAFLKERLRWDKGLYKIIVGGAGVLNVRPFLEFVDIFVLGRAEEIIVDLVNNIDSFENDSVVYSNKFDIDKKYKICQANTTYREITLPNGAKYKEGQIGCNHKCLYCGYTYHRRHTGSNFTYGDLWNHNENVEKAIIDWAKGEQIDFVKLHTTAIDGTSERLRFMVKKNITNNMLISFLVNLAQCGKNRKVRLYNIIGYPTETDQDYYELVEVLKLAEKEYNGDNTIGIILHSTPFRAMPATPMACAPMSYKNYRGLIGQQIGRGLKGGLFYQGKTFWAVEGLGTESLVTHAESVIVLRGTENDANNIARLAMSKKYWSTNNFNRQLTLESNFDLLTMFRQFVANDLPTRYLQTYASVEKMWDRRDNVL